MPVSEELEKKSNSKVAGIMSSSTENDTGKEWVEKQGQVRLDPGNMDGKESFWGKASKLPSWRQTGPSAAILFVKQP